MQSKYIWEVMSKWLTENLTTIPKVQLWGKASANGDTALLVDSDGHLQVDGLSTALPAGASTEAKQDDAISSLTGIDSLLTGIRVAVETIDNMISGSEAQVDVVASLPAGTNNIGNVSLAPQTSGGLSIFRSIDLDESEEEVKGSAGQLYGIIAINLHASDYRYLKIYNAPAASVTVGTTTPVMTIPLNDDWEHRSTFPNGIQFSSGITVAATTGLADADNGAPGANEVVVNILYK